MAPLDEAAERFYERLAARAEAEDYAPIEDVVGLPDEAGICADQLDLLIADPPLREENDDAHEGERPEISEA